MAKKTFPFPLGIETDVPLENLVRCRWRDEENYPEKIKSAEERIGVQGWRMSIDGVPLDTVEAWIDYFMADDPETYPTEEAAEVKARTMPLDKVEKLGGHNREEGMYNLLAMEAAGTLPAHYLPHPPRAMRVKIQRHTSAAARNIFMSDDDERDGQCAGWCLGAVRKGIPDMMRKEGITKSEAIARTARDTGRTIKEIHTMIDMLLGLDTGVLTPQVKRIKPKDAVLFWDTLVKVNAFFHVTFAQQDEIVDGYFKSADPRKSITYAFSDLMKAAGIEAPKTKKQNTVKDPEAYALQLAWKLATHLQEESFPDDAKQRIKEVLDISTKLVTTTPSEEDVEDDAIFARIQEQEDNDETVEQTAVH